MLEPIKAETKADMARVHGRSVLVAGAIGLVGQEIVAGLLADKNVGVGHCLSRRSLGLKHPKLSSHIVDFTAMPALPKVDECFIALGSTIKVAGSRAAFLAIDLDAVVAVAKAAHSAGAVGADRKLTHL